MKRLALLLSALPAFGQVQTFYGVNLTNYLNIKDRSTPAHYVSIYSTADMLRVYSSLTATEVATLDTSGNLVLTGTTTNTGVTSSGPVIIAGAAGTARNLDFLSGSSLRWIVRASNAPESGGDAGSNFEVRRYLDDGVTVDTPFSIARNTGNVTISKNLTVSGTCTGCGSTYTAGTGVTIAGSTISIGQAVGTGNSVTFSNITATVSSNLGIASSSSLSVAGAATIGVAGDIATSSSIVAGTSISSTGSFIRAATNFRVGAAVGITSGTCSHWTGGICDTP